MVLFVILKCNSNLSSLMNPYFATFNWHLQVLIMQKRNHFLNRSFFPDSGLVLINTHTDVTANIHFFCMEYCQVLQLNVNVCVYSNYIHSHHSHHSIIILIIIISSSSFSSFNNHNHHSIILIIILIIIISSSSFSSFKNHNHHNHHSIILIIQ